MRSVLFILARYSGLNAIYRFFFARKAVSIMVYHSPGAGVFRKHMVYCKKRYNLISMDELAGALDSGNWSAIPPRALLVSMDDGWKENAHLAGVCAELEIRPIIYLTGAIIGTGRKFWWTVCEPGQRQELKQVSNRERKRILDEQYGFDEEREYDGDRQALSEKEIAAMRPQFDFGSHTAHHPILTECSRDEMSSEILKGKQVAESALSFGLNDFAYPNGDFGEREKTFLRENGFRSARGLQPGWNRKGQDPFELRAMHITDEGSINRLSAELVGIPQTLYRTMHKLLG